MRFIDHAEIIVRSGKGGAGAVSFRREKYIPRGGPDGGDGGNGGSVIIEAHPGLQTLYDFTHRRHFKAKAGRPGGGRQKFGAAGEDLIIKVPLGTLVYDKDGDRLLGDLVEPGQRLVAAKGGRGGKGNKHFASSTNRAPRHAQPGEPAVERRLRLDLKLLADVALVGLPNAGKSTLIKMISAARPKVADYPFTTLNPNLGVVTIEEYDPFVVADIPGLIEGASQGAGLGHTFLRHVERTRQLVFLLDVNEEPEKALEVLAAELKAFSPDLASRRRLIALNKIDLLDEPLGPEQRTIKGEPVFAISALYGQGVEELVQAMAGMLAEAADE